MTSINAILQPSPGESPSEQQSLLGIENLQVGYATKQGVIPAVRGVSFLVNKGEKVAIVGESGSGKSTTAHAIINLLAPQAQVTGGAITLNGESLRELADRAWPRIRGRHIGLVPQDPGTALNPTTRVGIQVAEALQLATGEPRRVALAHAITLLGDVGLDRPELRARQYPHELSGGMRQRVLIAIAIAGNPDLIIADEPTSALDVSVQRTILDLLDHVAEQNHTAVLLITHDLAVAGDRADRLLVMHRGEIVEQGNTKEILKHPQTAYTRQLLAAAPTLAVPEQRGGVTVLAGAAVPKPRSADALVSVDTAASDLAVATDLATGPDSAATSGLETTSDLAAVPEPTAVSDLAAVSDLETAPVALAVRNLAKKFALGGSKQYVHAVNDVSFTIPTGSTFALVGESGSGKSTVTRLLVGLTKPDAGAITFDNQDVTVRPGNKKALANLRSQTGFVYQNPFASLNPRLTVGQIIAEPLLNGQFSRIRSPQYSGRVAELLGQVQLDPEFAHRRPGALSGGQRQRVAIARALAKNPKFLILDEPTSALDVSVQKQVLDLLVQLQQRHGLTYLFVTHDLAVVAQIADRVGVMQAGRLVEEGTTHQVFTQPTSDYTKHLLAAVPGRGIIKKGTVEPLTKFES